MFSRMLLPPSWITSQWVATVGCMPTKLDATPTMCLPHVQGSADVMGTHFLLSEGVYAKAELPPTDTVMLWLGVSSVCPTE